MLRDLTLPRNPVHSSTKASVERTDGPSSIQVGISPGRDYAALVELVSQLSRTPDGLAETILNETEAEQIRRLGFPAAPGQWFVPLLPHDLAQGNGLLECLSDAWAEDVDPRRLLPEQVEKSPAEIDEEDSVEPGDRIWSEDEVRVFEALQRAGGWVKRRRLQKNLWRLGSRRFNEALASLQARGALELNGSMIRLTVTEQGKKTGNPSANLQTHSNSSLSENAALFQPAETVIVYHKDRRRERLTG